MVIEEVHELPGLHEDVLEEQVRDLARPDGVHHVILHVVIENLRLLHGQHQYASKNILVTIQAFHLLSEFTFLTQSEGGDRADTDPRTPWAGHWRPQRRPRPYLWETG